MTFQFACRKPPSGKDLEPAGPAKLACPVRVPYTLMGSIFKKKEGIALITGYPDNHCLVTRYPDNRYETRLTQPKRAALPSNEIQSTKYYVRNYQRIMQNKPNFRKSQMNVSNYYTTDYERKRNWTLGENKANSNPIKPNLRKAKMNVNLTLTKDYRKNDDFVVRINKPNFVKGPK